MLALFQAFRIWERLIIVYLRNHFKAPHSHRHLSTTGKSPDSPGWPSTIKAQFLPTLLHTHHVPGKWTPLPPTRPLLLHLWAFALAVPFTWTSLPPAQSLGTHILLSFRLQPKHTLQAKQGPHSSGTTKALHLHLLKYLSSCVWYHSYWGPIEPAPLERIILIWNSPCFTFVLNSECLTWCLA